MKLQFQPGSMRVRLGEAELASLLEGGTLRLDLHHGGARLLDMRVMLDECLDRQDDAFQLQASDDAAWQLVLAHHLVHAYAQTLPRRDALVLSIASCNEDTASLRTVTFEVDVRDSVRTRGPKPRKGGPERS